MDTNLLILLLVGNFDPTLIGKFKRLSTYSLEDFQTLDDLLLNFDRIIYSPHVLTELTNLTDNLPIKRPALFFEYLALVFNEDNRFSEDFESSSEIMKTKAFIKLGLADSAVVQFSYKYIIFTDDLELYSFVESYGNSAINVNHLR